MIDFELPYNLKAIKEVTHSVGKEVFRPIARKYDEQEHTKADEIDFFTRSHFYCWPQRLWKVQCS